MRQKLHQNVHNIHDVFLIRHTCFQLNSGIFPLKFNIYFWLLKFFLIVLVVFFNLKFIVQHIVQLSNKNNSSNT